VSNNNKKIKP